MKKVNFFKVMSACVAFAAVTFTSCSEEEMTLTAPDVMIPEMPETPVIPATASVSVSVYDVTSSQLLGVTSVDATDNINGSMSIECPSYDGYIVAPAITVAIPDLKDGQSVVVPVVFYVASEGTAVATIVDQLNKAIADKKGTVIEDFELIPEEKETIQNENKRYKEYPAEELNYYSGLQYVGETEKPESKAAATGYEFVESILKENYNFEEKTFKSRDFFVNPYHQTTISYKQAGKIVVYEIEFNGTKYYAEFKEAGEAVWSMSEHTIIPEYEHEWSHLHAHGLAGHDWLHGDNNNAGGGIAKPE